MSVVPLNSSRQQGASRDYLKWIEMHGMAIRKKAGASLNGPFNPQLFSEELGFVIGGPALFETLGEGVRQKLAEMDAKTWSGGAMRLGDGRLLILLNPNQTPERAAVTVMEEVAHSHFGHRPSLSTDSVLGLGRTFDPDAEKEAYWAAAATLLPSSDLARAVWRGTSPNEIASIHGVSLELVEFRTKILGLWSYQRDSAL